MATVAVGARSTSNTLSAAFAVDMWDQIPALEDSEAELAKFLYLLKKDTSLHAKRADFMYTEILPQMDLVSGAHDSSTLTFTVDNINYWAPNDVVQVPDTGETMVIESVNSASSQFTVRARSNGTTAAAALDDNDQIINLGPATAEGGSLPAARSVVETEVQNYVQLFWSSVQFTGTDIAINERKGRYGGNEVDRGRKHKLLEHLRKIDSAALWGESAQSGDVRTMGGINAHIPTAQADSTAGLTRAVFNAFLRDKGMRYSSSGGMKKKVLVCSWDVAGYINTYATDVIRTKTGESKHGIQMLEYISPFGPLTLIPHTNFQSTTHKKYAFLIDTTDVARCVLRDTKLYVDLDNGLVDAKTDAYLTEMTMRWGHPYHHAKLTGVTGAS